MKSECHRPRRAPLSVTLSSLLLVGAVADARAGIPEVLAPSPASMGRAGAGQGLPDGGAAAVENPAGVALDAADQVRLSGTFGHIDLAPVEGVTRIDGRTGEVPQGAIAPHSLALDFQKTVGPWFALGGTVVFPMPWLYYHDTKDPWVPHAFRWQNRAAQATLALAAAVRIPIFGAPAAGAAPPGMERGGLWIGGGVGVLPRANIEIDLDLAGVPDLGAGEPGIDVVLHDVDLAVRARLRPHLGAVLDFGAVRPELAGVRVGVTWRGQTQADIDPIHLGVHVLSLGELHGLFSLVDRIDASVWLGLTDLWDPHQIEIGLAVDRPRFALAVDLCWSQWSKLLPSYGRVVEGLDGERGVLELAVDLGDAEPFRYGVGGSRSVDTLRFRDGWDLSVGGEARSGTIPGPLPARVILRGGYRFVPQVVDPGTGPMALLDGDAHTVSVGGGLALPSALRHLRGDVRVDAAVLVTRIRGGPVGRDPAALASYQGLPIAWTDDAHWGGGWVAAGGLSLTVPLGS